MEKKIITILGTRPEIIRLSCIIKKLDNSFKHILVNTNQNYDKNLNKVFFNQLRLRSPKYSLKIKNKSPIEFIGKTLIEVDKILDKERPDGVIVLGDTNSGLSAMCAKKRKIPIFHLEAGNRCHDERVPEEINRRIIDHFSDINLTYSNYATSNLVGEGIPKDRIIKLGSPLFEVYETFKKDIQKSSIIKKLGLEKKKYILASVHREENVDIKSKLIEIMLSLDHVSKKYNLPIIFSTHPRTEKKIKQLKFKSKKLLFFKPFNFYDYANLMGNCKLIMSDSGSITEETSILKIPSVILRDTFERQEGLERGLSIISKIKKEHIINSVKLSLLKNNYESHPDYSIKNVSENFANIVHGYIDYINDKVWFK